jgi:endonuclease/exonuclease/phosphatase family metal-dependent hydrolase
MDIRSDFSSLPSGVYKNRVYSNLGKAGDSLLHFSEKTGIMVKNQYQRWRRGGNPEHYKFYIKLNTADNIETDFPDAFPTPRKKEKKVQKFLFGNRTIRPVEAPTLRSAFVGNVIETVNSLFVLIVAGVAGIVTGPSALAALGIRRVLQSKRNDIVGIAPKGGQEYLNLGDDLSVLTLNVPLPDSEIMNSVNGMSKTSFRSEGLSRFLVNQNSDIVCLQEAFHSQEILDRVVPGLTENKYAVALGVKPQKTLGLSSGLMIASKFPIREIGFHEFSNSEGVDKRAKKGVLMALIEVKEGEFICVANTHMQAKFNGDDAAEKRKDQFIAAKGAIDEFCRKSDVEVKDIIFCGDFNTSRYKMQQRFKLTQARETFDYFSMEKGLLQKDKKTKTRYKDLTKADVCLNYKQFSKRRMYTELTCPSERIRNNESGSVKGTVLETQAYTHSYFLPYVIEKVWKDVQNGFGAELAQKIEKRHVGLIVKDRAEGNDQTKISVLNGDEIIRIGKIAKRHLRKAKKKMFVKPECVDHICLAQRKNNIFSERDYSYKIKTPIGKEGVLSDHRAVIVKLKQN